LLIAEIKHDSHNKHDSQLTRNDPEGVEFRKTTTNRLQQSTYAKATADITYLRLRRANRNQLAHWHIGTLAHYKICTTKYLKSAQQKVLNLHNKTP